MLEAERGQYYFEVRNGDFVYKQKFIGQEGQFLVPGIVAGRDDPSQLSRALLMVGVFGAIAIPGVFFLDNPSSIGLAVAGGAISAMATGITYDHFAKIRHLSQRRVDKQLLLS